MPTTPDIDANGAPIFEVQLQALTEGINGNGVQDKTDLTVTAGSGDLELDISSGTAVYDGATSSLGATTTVTLSSGDATNDRWDTVVYDVGAGSVVVREGAPDQYPSAPNLQGDDVLLAVVSVEAEATAITTSDIYNWRVVRKESAVSGANDGTVQVSALTQVNAADGVALTDSGNGVATVSVNVAEFIGNALTDASGDIAVASDGIQTDELDLSITPTWTGEHTFDAGITGLPKPSADTDAARKQYVDALEQGLDIKDSVRVATESGIDLSTATDPNPVDGVTLSDGDRVLLKDQATASENGLYQAVTATDPTTWTRTPDADADDEVTAGAFVFVEEGSANQNRGFVVTSDDPISLGTDPIEFTQFSGAGQLTAGNALTKTGDTLDVASNSIDSDELVSDSLTLNGVTAALGETATLALRDLRVTTSVSAATTTNGEDTVFVDSSGTGGVTVTLGSGDAVAGQEITIQDTGGAASSNTITVDTEGGETFADGDAAKTITTDRGWLTARWDGTQWVSDRYQEVGQLDATAVSTEVLDGDILFAAEYSSLNAAYEDASNGDTIYLGNQTYDEELTIRKQITLQGSHRANSYIQGDNDNGPTVFMDNVNYVTLKDVYIQNLGTGDAVHFDVSAGGLYSCRLRGTVILGNSNRGDSNNIVGNWFEGNNVTINGDANAVIGNTDVGAITDNGTGNEVANNT